MKSIERRQAGQQGDTFLCLLSVCANQTTNKTRTMKQKRIKLLHWAVTLLTAFSAVAAQAADKKKPNIVVIWGDDIGWFNISAYNQGMMGYKTPNIDRVAKGGALFTDWYGQNSCTPAARASSPARSVFAPACSRSVCGREGRFAGARRDHCPIAQGAGLHDRAVRQEPRRRPRRASAHGAWL